MLEAKKVNDDVTRYFGIGVLDHKPRITMVNPKIDYHEVVFLDGSRIYVYGDFIDYIGEVVGLVSEGKSDNWFCYYNGCFMSVFEAYSYYIYGVFERRKG